MQNVKESCSSSRLQLPYSKSDLESLIVQLTARIKISSKCIIDKQSGHRLISFSSLAEGTRGS